jgi:RNA polymerase sigma-70 factor, ECF subfamily
MHRLWQLRANQIGCRCIYKVVMVNEEERWVDAAQRGDREAFRHLVEAHARPLFTLCARITRDAALAEDAVQEALFNAYRHLADFDKRCAFKTWLHRIAVNAALEQLRRRHDNEIVSTDLGNSEEDFLSSHAVESPGPAQHARGAEIRRRIDAELACMSVVERTAFVMRHAEGQSLNDISRTLSLNVGACKQAIFRAVRKLRGALQSLR